MTPEQTSRHLAVLRDHARILGGEPPEPRPVSDAQILAESLAEHRAEERKDGERVSDWTAERMFGGDAA